MESILRTENLCKYYGTGENCVKAVDNTNIEIKRGEFVAIVGKSGSGKSTLLHLMGGLDYPTSGKVFIGDVDIYSMKEDELAVIRRRKIGFIFQAFNLVSSLNIWENVVLPLGLDDRKVDKEWVTDVLRTLGIEDKKNNLPETLSGGQQLKRLINREGMSLALPAVPLGALVGYLAAYFSFGWLVDTVKVMQNNGDFQFAFFTPAAVLGTMILAFLTVWLAMIKPKRSIAKVSAVEAISYRDGIQKKSSKKSGIRKGSENINERKLALANIASGKKQAVLTMATMGLSCVMFVVMANCLGNIDTNFEARKSVAHGQFEIALDYTFYDEAYPENNLDIILKTNPLDSSLIQEIKAIDGVTEVSSSDILVMDHGGQLESIVVLSREDFEKEKKEGADIGNLDYDKASEEDQIIFGWSSFMDDMTVNEGDKIDYTVDNGSEKKSFSSDVGGAFGNCNGGWAVTEDTYRHMGFKPGECMGTVWVDCSEKDVDEVEEQLQQILSSKKHLEMESFKQNVREQEFGAMMIRYAIYTLLAVIGIIGFANLANTMIINITTRRREYGIMQAVGMTGKQLGKSLSYQGIIYICGTIAVSVIVGIPMGYAAFRWRRKSAVFGMNVYHFPGLELIVMTAVLVAMQIALSWLLSRNLKRESLVDRIRY